MASQAVLNHLEEYHKVTRYLLISILYTSDYLRGGALSSFMEGGPSNIFELNMPLRKTTRIELDVTALFNEIIAVIVYFQRF